MASDCQSKEGTNLITHSSLSLHYGREDSIGANSRQKSETQYQDDTRNGAQPSSVLAAHKPEASLLRDCISGTCSQTTKEILEYARSP